MSEVVFLGIGFVGFIVLICLLASSLGYKDK
jgi:hypothetical protein